MSVGDDPTDQPPGIPGGEGAHSPRFDPDQGWGQDSHPNRLRPLNLGDVLDGTFRLVRDHWRAFALGIGAMLLPSMVLIFLLALGLFGAAGLSMSGRFGDLALAPSAGDLFGALADLFLAMLVVWLVVAVIAGLINGVAVHVAAVGYRTGRVQPMQSLGATMRRVPGLLGAVLLLILVASVLPGLVLLALGAVWVFIVGQPPGLLLVVLLYLAYLAWALIVTARLVATVPALLVEGLGPVQALRRSNSLVKGNTGMVLGTIIVIAILVVIMTVIVSVLFNLIGAALNDVSGVLSIIVTFIGTFTAYVVSIALYGAAQVLIYYNRRVGKEGYDLTELAGELGDRPAPSW